MAVGNQREARLAIVGRRLVTVPLVLGVALLLLLAAPVVLPLAALADLPRRRRFATLRLAALATAYLACEAAGILAAFALWLVHSLSRGDRERYLERNFRLQCWWAGTLLAAGRRIYGFDFEVESEAELGRGPILVFLRHASLADTLLGPLLFSIPHRLRLRYVLKRELLWDPCLDIVGNRLPNIFVHRDGTDSVGEIRGIAELARGLGPGDGVLIYPEGTRFTAAKRERVLERLRQKGDARLVSRAERMRNVLPPRSGGPLALLEAAPQADVVFCMHAGLEDAATLGDLWAGRLIGRRVRVRCTIVPSPASANAAPEWLLDHWEEVDAFVGAHRKPV